MSADTQPVPDSREWWNAVAVELARQYRALRAAAEAVVDSSAVGSFCTMVSPNALCELRDVIAAQSQPPEPIPKDGTGTVPESSLTSTDDKSPLARAQEGAT